MSPSKKPETSVWANRKCLSICAIVAIANMQYGLDSAAIGALQAMPGFLKIFGYPDPTKPGGYGIDGTFQRLIGSLLTLGAFLSSLVAGAFAHYFGRKAALWFACLLNAIACIVQISSENKVAVYIGRLILGLANGFLVTFSNIYTAEASPAHLRAVMVALFSEWVNIGSIIGATVTNRTKDFLSKSSYQIPLGTLFIVPAILSIGLLFVPESPRYLLYRGDEEAARKSLEALRGDSLPLEELELEWVEMVRGIEEEKRTAKTVGALDMFKGVRPLTMANLRVSADNPTGTELRRTLLCYGVIATQTGAGSWFVISYSTYFMTVAGLSVNEAFKFSILNTVLGFIGVNFGIYLMRHVMGRRTILMTGAVTQGAAMLGLAVSATVASGTFAARSCLIAFLAIYQFSYNAFVGDATYPTATELVSTRLRSWSVGSAISLGYLLAWLTSFFSPYFINPENLNWGAKYGYIWAGSNLACFLFFYIFLPETKGRTLEEIDELFDNRVPVRKFKTYHTVIVDEAMKDVKQRSGGAEKNTASVTEAIDRVSW
ncbi:general substrate transporter [Astrocystis sublimbata]|nr:general substrate transporter [Astrocystis sublimbata]